MNNEVFNPNDIKSNDLTHSNNVLHKNSNVNLNQNQNKSYVNVVPDFSKEELNAVVIHKHIAREVRMEKYKMTFSIFLSFIVICVSSFFLALYFTTDSNGLSFVGIKKESIPYPVLTIAGLVIPLIVIVMNFIHLGHLNVDVKRYKSELIMGRERIPLFLFNAYKRIVKNYIYLNWFSFSIYLYVGITTGILLLVNKIKSVHLDSTIIILILILCSTAVIQIFSLIFNYKRKGNIDAYYGYEIVTLDQQIQLRKEVNKTCMIIFFSILCIILFVIVIPIILIRKKQNKKLFWFI